MSDVYADAAGQGESVDMSSGVVRMPLPGPAFEPFPSDTFRVTRRLAHTAVDQRPAVVRQLVAQALEELARSHRAACFAPGMDCDECWWLSKALAAARAGGWLAGRAGGR